MATQKIVNNKETFPCDIEFSYPQSRPSAYFTLDIETCGLDPHLPIIEIGMVYVVDGKVVDTYSSLVRPHKIIPTTISEITGITNNMVKTAPELSDVPKVLSNFIGDEPLPIFVHNALFDAMFLYCHGVFDYIVPDCPICDSECLARSVYPAERSYTLDTLNGRFNLYEGKSHRALDDALCEAALVERCYEVIEHDRRRKLKYWRPTEQEARAASVDGKLHCIYCGSAQIIKQGIRNGLQRYKCKGCGRRSSYKK